MEVGVRQFREQLSVLLARVKEGEEIVITERGMPVACVRRPDAHDHLQQLIDAGLARAPKRPKRVIQQILPVKATASVADIVIEHRKR